MAERAELACPVVRRAACLHRDQALFEIGKPAHESLAHNRFAYHDTLGTVDRMNLHDVLRQIHTNTSNLVHDFSLPRKVA
ncbi:hypothetical protein D9M69_109550 [compost metagenome]